MTRHLSDEEISAWVLGERTPMQEAHLAGCRECGIRTGRLQAALSGFRESAIAWAAREQHAVPVPTAPRWWQPRSQWLLAAAALVLMTAVPAYRSYSAHLSAARERTVLDAAEDTALLNQVDTQISRAVPGPMEPLVPLVAWNTDANDTHKGNNETNR
ncbi:MAG: hypothetical protein QOJ99_4435 [Bryobacterales bacterium]|jgi:hypothetical protein|nr:hypothetical protein [Bryobacterales bacterium]